MITIPTYWANIYVGLREGYNVNMPEHDIDEVRELCEDYCDEMKLGVTVTPTQFIYVGGSEGGAIVGLVNYPRFPREDMEIRHLALELAETLKNSLGQQRVSIVFPDETVMLGEP